MNQAISSELFWESGKRFRVAMPAKKYVVRFSGAI